MSNGIQHFIEIPPLLVVLNVFSSNIHLSPVWSIMKISWKLTKDF